MKILLLDPPLFRFLGENQPSPPLGLAYLSAFLKMRGFTDVIIYNADYNPNQNLPECNKNFSGEVDQFEIYKTAVTNEKHPIYQEVLDNISQKDPDIIGISIKTSKFFVSKKLIEKIKKYWPHKVVISGGPHVTSNYPHVLKRTKTDFCVIGEGEETLYELIDAIRKNNNFDKIKGIAFRKPGRVHFTGRRGLISNLDLLPFPDKQDGVFFENILPDQLGSIFSSRGCPFACAFCDSRNTWTRKVRRRSPANIIDEILKTKSAFNTTFFSFSDDCFVTNKRQLMSFTKALDKAGLAKLPKSQFRWWCEIHANIIDEDIIKAMKASNCVAIAIGLESGSQKTLDMINKKCTLEKVRKAAEIIKNSGIELVIFAMIGFPWETEDDIWETVDFFLNMRPDSGNLSVVTPLPNTPLYKYCKEGGLIDYDIDFLNCFHQRNSKFFSNIISEERSRIIIKEVFETVAKYVDESRIKRIEKYLTNTVFQNYINKIKPIYHKYKLVLETNNLKTNEITKLAKNIYMEFPQYLYIDIINNNKTYNFSFISKK